MKAKKFVLENAFGEFFVGVSAGCAVCSANLREAQRFPSRDAAKALAADYQGYYGMESFKPISVADARS